jgi:hypothetical protein
MTDTDNAQPRKEQNKNTNTAPSPGTLPTMSAGEPDGAGTRTKVARIAAFEIGVLPRVTLLGGAGHCATAAILIRASRLSRALRGSPSSSYAPRWSGCFSR